MSGKTYGQNAPGVISEIEQLAKNDHIVLLEKCLENYQAKYIHYMVLVQILTSILDTK